MAVELYHRDDDDVRVTFDGSHYHDYMRLSAYRHAYCVDKRGRYMHVAGRVLVGQPAHSVYDFSPKDVKYDDTLGVCVAMPHTKTSEEYRDKTFYLRIVL